MPGARINRFSGPQQYGRIPWTYLHGYGTLAERPDATPQNAGFFFFVVGDSMYRSNGKSWDVVGGGGGSGITELTGDVTAGPGSGSQAATIANSAVTLAKIANAAANSKLVGSGSAGSGSPYSEIALGSGLTMTGTTLSAAGSGGTVTSIVVGAGLTGGTITTTGTIALDTPGTLTVSSSNTATGNHTHAITSSSAPGAAASLLATDASGIIGSTGTRIVKGWFIDLTVTNAIAGSITGNAATATALQNARTIGGVSFDGTANITVSTATGGFTVSGGNLALGTNSLTLTGSIGSTGSRVTKLWATDITCTNAIAADITGNAATVTTNANLTGQVTSSGNAALLDKTAITGQTADASPDAAADYVLTYDASATNLKKVLIANLPAGGTPTVITVANEATDTTCFLSFFTAATGDLGPKTNAFLAFNSNTGKLTMDLGALAATYLPALALVNTQAATVGSQSQGSPSTLYTCHAWDVDGAFDVQFDFKIAAAGANANSPSGILSFLKQTAGGGYSTAMGLDSIAGLSITNGLVVSGSSSQPFTITGGAASSLITSAGALTITSAAAATWGTATATSPGTLTIAAGNGSGSSSNGADLKLLAGDRGSTGNSGSITIDTGLFSVTSGTISIGTSLAGTISIGHSISTVSITAATIGFTATTIGGAVDGQLMQNVNGVAVGIELAQVCDFRCTLASGNFVYNPQPATPSSTDTTNEFVTFAAAHGWTTGTMVYVNTTASGLTAGTTYWINALSTTTAAFYTTLAKAEADASPPTNRVNLTGNVTAEVRPVGVQSTTLKFTPGSVGNRITLYDGTRWRMYTSAEMTLALTATVSTLYYIYCYSNSGTPTLEVSTTGTTTQDGVLVKSGATTRRLVGLAWCVATNTFEDSGGAGAYAFNRTLVSWYNRRLLSCFLCPNYSDDNAATSYSAPAGASYTALSGNSTGLWVATGEDAASFEFDGLSSNSGANTNRLGMAIDVVTSLVRTSQLTLLASQQVNHAGRADPNMPLGKHSVIFAAAQSAGTMTLIADGARAGSTFDPPATYISGFVMG